MCRRRRRPTPILQCLIRVHEAALDKAAASGLEQVGGVVGRRAGSVEGYSYSTALKNSNLTWDEATLDSWLTNPSALVPGTKMFFKIDDPQARSDIIAYLKELK